MVFVLNSYDDVKVVIVQVNGKNIEKGIPMVVDIFRFVHDVIVIDNFDDEVVDQVII